MLNAQSLMRWLLSALQRSIVLLSLKEKSYGSLNNPATTMDVRGRSASS